MGTFLVSAGKAITTARLVAGTQPLPVNIGWGTGATPITATSTTLSTETGTRVAGTPSQQTTTVTNDTWQLVGTITAGGTLAITNAGCFDASTSGNMFVAGDFATINLSSGDAIAFTIKCQYS